MGMPGRRLRIRGKRPPPPKFFADGDRLVSNTTGMVAVNRARKRWRLHGKQLPEFYYGEGPMSLELAPVPLVLPAADERLNVATGNLSGHALSSKKESSSENSSSSSSSSESEAETTTATPPPTQRMTAVALSDGKLKIPKDVQKDVAVAAKPAQQSHIVVDERISAMIVEVMAGRLTPEDLASGKLATLARDIATELQRQLANPRPQLRALLWNLRDLSNPDFVAQVWSRTVLPEQLATLSSEEMASGQKRAVRAAQQAEVVRESTLARGLSGAVDQFSLAAYKVLRSRK